MHAGAAAAAATMGPMYHPAISPRCTALALAAACAAVALAGCGSKSDSDRATTAPRTTSTGGQQAERPAALPGRAAQDAAVKRLAALGKPIFCGAGTQPLVALTFDDGPGPYTHIALRQLREAGGRATFFLVARSIARYPQWPARERELAAIGNHTMTHPDLAAIDPAAAAAEIDGGRAAALRAAGPPVDLFRPPYGRHNAQIDEQVRDAGVAEILWDVDSADSRVSPPADFHEIAARVRRNARPGSIVLMHENRGQTIRAMRSILPALKRRRLRLVTVPELLAADPPTPAQLAKGRRGCGEPKLR
ncbi:MAG: peptidoglycan-N-acetylglucosamine deacetylase [bacterium]